MGKTLKRATAEATRAYDKPLSSYKDKDGNPLPKKVKYDFEWYEWEDEQSMIDGKDELTHKEQLKVRQVEAKTTARQAANSALLLSLGIVKPNEETDSYIRLKKAYDGFYGKLISKMPAELSEDEQKTYRAEANIKARAKAAEFLEEDWPSEAEEE